MGRNSVLAFAFWKNCHGCNEENKCECGKIQDRKVARGLLCSPAREPAESGLSVDRGEETDARGISEEIHRFG